MKKKNTKKNLKSWIVWTCFSILFVVAFVLADIYDMSAQFWINDFGTVFASNLEVYCLDVGQASANLIVFPNETAMVIDTGSTESADSFVEQVKTLLKRNSIDEIDYLLLTHSDEDHVGGAVELLSKFQVNNIIRPKILSNSSAEPDDAKNFTLVETTVYSNAISAVYAEPNCTVQYVGDACSIYGTELTLKYWSPQKESYSEVNSYCPFVTLEYKGKSFMFTGDATAEREREFLSDEEAESVTSVDFLFVAHHGSKYSSTQDFLSQINPRYAIIGAGDSTHPSQEVISRLNDVGVENIYITKEVGMIGIGVDENSNFYIKDMGKHFSMPLVVTIFACFLLIVGNIIVDPKFQRLKKFRSKAKRKNGGTTYKSK